MTQDNQGEVLQPKETSADGKIYNDSDEPIHLDAPVTIIVTLKTDNEDK